MIWTRPSSGFDPPTSLTTGAVTGRLKQSVRLVVVEVVVVVVVEVVVVEVVVIVVEVVSQGG